MIVVALEIAACPSPRLFVEIYAKLCPTNRSCHGPCFPDSSFVFEVLSISEPLSTSHPCNMSDFPLNVSSFIVFSYAKSFCARVFPKTYFNFLFTAEFLF